MAYNEITLPYWQNLVRRKFGLVGPGGNVAVVAPEIQPVVVIAPAGEEDRRLRGEDKYGFSQGGIGTGLNRPYVGLVNPVGSNKLGVIFRISAAAFDTGGAANVGKMVIDTTTNLAPFLGTIQNVVPEDVRTALVPGSPTAGLSPQTGSSAALTTGFPLRFWNQIGTNIREIVVEAGIILLPGWGIAVTNQSVAASAQIEAHFDWYEKPFEPSEANLT